MERSTKSSAVQGESHETKNVAARRNALQSKAGGRCGGMVVDLGNAV